MGQNKDIVSALVVALGAGLAAFRVITTVVKAFTVVQGILNVVMSANPVALVVIAIAALAAGLIYAYHHSETFRNVVDTAFKGVAAAGRWLWNNALAPVIRFIVGGFGAIADKIGDFLDGLSNIPGFGWAKDAADKMHGAAKKAKEFADNIRDIPDPNIDTSKIDAQMAAFYKKWSGKAVVVNATMHEDLGNYRGHRATGGPVMAGGAYAVGDNPDGSWNKTTELFVPRTSGTILNQAQLAGVGGGTRATLSQSDIDRLAYAMSRVRLATTVSASSVDRALG